jgi:hypothetical protein
MRPRIRPDQNRSVDTSKTLLVRPRNVAEISQVLSSTQQYPSPVRAVGADSGNPRCTRVQHGTRLEMSAMNRPTRIDGHSVTVEAGMRLRDLARTLADQGRELIGSYEEPDRTVGGVISSGSLTAGPAEDGAHLAASVTAIGVVAPDGRQVNLDTRQPKGLAVLRQSYGLLGIVHSVTLKTRPTRVYSIRHRQIKFAELPDLLANLATIPGGVKLFLLPFRGSAFIELRQPAENSQLRVMNWKIGDWVMNRLMPSVSHSLARSFSISGIRDPLIDSFSQASQMLTQSSFVDAGSNAMEQTSQFRRVGESSRIRTCTWAFPAGLFGAALGAYRDFSRRHNDLTGYRCDLPSIGYRLTADRSALLSPSFVGPVFALNIRSTIVDGWEDFLLDFSRIASAFQGIPLFNLTRHFTAEQTATAYANQLRRFRDIRRRTDPKNRLLNQFFLEHIG